MEKYRFSVADQVKVVADFSGFKNIVGHVAEIVEDCSLPYTVVFDGYDFCYFAESELELVQ